MEPKLRALITAATEYAAYLVSPKYQYFKHRQNQEQEALEKLDIALSEMSKIIDIVHTINLECQENSPCEDAMLKVNKVHLAYQKWQELIDKNMG